MDYHALLLIYSALLTTGVIMLLSSMGYPKESGVTKAEKTYRYRAISCLLINFWLLSRCCNPVLTGSSVHNQRIYIQMSVYYQVFHYLEDSGFLDLTSEIDLFCLHFVFT